MIKRLREEDLKQYADEIMSSMGAFWIKLCLVIAVGVFMLYSYITRGDGEFVLYFIVVFIGGVFGLIIDTLKIIDCKRSIKTVRLANGILKDKFTEEKKNSLDHYFEISNVSTYKYDFEYQRFEPKSIPLWKQKYKEIIVSAKDYQSCEVGEEINVIIGATGVGYLAIVKEHTTDIKQGY